MVGSRSPLDLYLDTPRIMHRRIPLKTAEIPLLRNKREAIALRVQEGRTYKTVDEVRAEAGLKPPGKEGLGHLILNREHCAGIRPKNGGGGGASLRGTQVSIDQRSWLVRPPATSAR
jgi:hypothetical protein